MVAAQDPETRNLKVSSNFSGASKFPASILPRLLSAHLQSIVIIKFLHPYREPKAASRLNHAYKVLAQTS
jgi:hypothetical protein